MHSVTCEQSLHLLRLYLIPSEKTTALTWTGRHFLTNFKITKSFCMLSETLQTPRKSPFHCTLFTFSLSAFSWAGRHYKDSRTWRSRLQNLHANWASLIPFLVDVYLTWKDSAKGHCQCPLGRPASCAAEYDFTIHTVDIFTLERSALISRSADCRSPSIALILQGYMGNTPHSPSYAVSLRTLEYYRLLRLCKPSLSVEAFAKVICDSYGVSLLFMIYILSLIDVVTDTLCQDLPHCSIINIRHISYHLT